MKKPRPLPSVRIDSIHHSPLSGPPLLLFPDRLLVRWPELVALPRLGQEVQSVVVHVPFELREDVRQVLFARYPLDRCDAAKRVYEHKRGWRILRQLFDRGHAHKMLAVAVRVTPELRAQIQAQGEGLSLRRLIQIAYDPALASTKDPPQTSSTAPVMAPLRGPRFYSKEQKNGAARVPHFIYGPPLRRAARTV